MTGAIQTDLARATVPTTLEEAPEAILHYKQPSLGDGEGWGGDTERGEERETGKRGRDAEKARKRRVSEGEWEGCTGGKRGTRAGGRVL